MGSFYLAEPVNKSWQVKIKEILEHGNVCAPRGQEIKELLGEQVVFSMADPIVTVASRELNYKFAFGEAWWICSGSNRVKDITRFMKKYSQYSDDGVFLRGAYGPKFVEQLPYVVRVLENDRDSRQAVLNIWRERPEPSKDIPCTLSQQYFIRDNQLHAVATMRSNDLVWGFCYDSFTFSCMAKCVQLMLRQKYPELRLGNMHFTAGSMHIYKPFYEKSVKWSEDAARSEVGDHIGPWLYNFDGDYESFITQLESKAVTLNG